MTEKKGLIEAAHEYAGEGIPVFPLYGNKKLPGGHGHHDATTNHNAIDAWGQDNITGLATAYISYTVLDFDIKHGEDPYAELKAWAADKGGYDSRQAAKVRTPSGGEHHIFEGNHPISKAGLLPGLDAKCEKGWVRVPPTDGYEWLTDKPWEMDTATLPEWFGQLEHNATAGVELPAIDGIQEGNRNDSLAQALGIQRKKGMDANELVTYALGWNQQIASPLPRAEVLQVAVGMVRYEQGTDRDYQEQQSPDDSDVKVTMADMYGMDFPPDIPILGPINQGKIVMFIAPTGSGKTFFAHALAESIATGTHLSHWRCDKAHEVVVVDGEMTGTDLVRIGRDLGNVGNYEVIGNALLKDKQINLMLPQWQDWLIEKIGSPELVLFDNMYSLFPTTHELSSISAEYMQVIQGFLVRLKQRNITSILFDHPGKSGKQFGTSAKTWGCDVVGAMSRDKSEGFEEGQAGFYLSFKGEDGGKVRGRFTNDHSTSKWLLDGVWKAY
jgi:hypothetical protein